MSAIKYTHIIWDWNGTLLNDVAWNITTINTMLKKRGLPVLGSVEAYRRVFGFPVKDYYRRVGFDFEKESFEILVAEHNALYHGSESSYQLFPGVKEILVKLQNKGLRQTVLSASERNNLLSQIKPFDIEIYFDEILGISDIFATSKVEIGMDYINRIKPEKAVLIGDTTHDKDVSDALGIDCILIASGHQSKNALLSCGATVVDHLVEIENLIP